MLGVLITLAIVNIIVFGLTFFLAAKINYSFHQIEDIQKQLRSVLIKFKKLLDEDN